MVRKKIGVGGGHTLYESDSIFHGHIFPASTEMFPLGPVHLFLIELSSIELFCIRTLANDNWVPVGFRRLVGPDTDGRTPVTSCEIAVRLSATGVKI